MDVDDVEGIMEKEVEHDPFTTPQKNLIVGEGIPVIEQPVDPPAEGMTFSSWEDLDYYLRVYGKQNGFGVVRASGGNARGGKDKEKGKRNATWTCEFYGKPRCSRKLSFGQETMTDSFVTAEVFRTKKTKKCECPVEFYGNINPAGEWVLRRVILEHVNHNPTLRKSKNIATFRVDELKKNPHILKKLENDRQCGVPVAQVYSCLARERNGVDEMPFAVKDLHDILAKKRRLRLSEGDANAMVKYFNTMTAYNQNFFHMHRVDEIGRMKDIMWVDARSRAAYVEFGDVVCFDSTYLTNEYELPFSNFMGVNHHGQSILLGCALVSHEDAETFGWLFDTWLLCMGGKAPSAILTDQDAAMRKALGSSMPNTTHRWCLWHILQKFCKKLGKRERYGEIKEALENAIYDSLDAVEFEESWCNAISEYGLEDDDWLSGLFENRQMWVPAYLKHIFWAGMRTTQRVESINSFFDGYLNKHTRLYEFAERYVEAMEVRAKDEKDADDNTLRYVRKTISGFSIERVFQKHYTDAKFNEFHIELSQMMYLNLLEKNYVLEDVFEYIIMDRVWVILKKSRKEVVTDRKRIYHVKFDNVSKEANCDCKLFESNGILCRHIVKVFDLNCVKVLPEKYILRRWRKDVTRKHTRVKVAYHDPTKTVEVQRHDNMMVSFEPVSERASTSKECVDFVIKVIQLLKTRVDEILEASGSCRQQTPVMSALLEMVHRTARSDQGHCSEVVGYADSGSVLEDPPIPKKKAHRTTDRRYLSCIEKGKGAKKQPAKKNKRLSKATPTKSIDPLPVPPETPATGDCGLRYATGGIQVLNANSSIRYFTRYGEAEMGMSPFFSPPNPNGGTEDGLVGVGDVGLGCDLMDLNFP